MYSLFVHSFGIKRELRLVIVMLNIIDFIPAPFFIPILTKKDTKCLS